MPELSTAIDRLATTDVLLVALDFDGTLAPLVDDPAAARALPEAQAAMSALLELPRTRVALVSGRALDSLLDVSFAPDQVLLSGSHGVELRLDAPPSAALTGEEQERVGSMGDALRDVARKYRNVWVEEKPAGFAVHTRLATPEDALAAVAEAEAVSGRLDGLTLRRGKDVLEFSVRSTDKGHALDRLRTHSGATAVFFAGDDVTDEDAFASLRPGDLGLKCGSGATLAEFSVADAHEVARVLADLATRRQNAIQG